MERVATRPQKSPDAIVNPGRPLPPRLSNAGAGVHGGSDILNSGANYGSAQANAYKKSAAYRKAVVDTFLHQDDPQKTAIVQGALKHPSFEGNVVLAAIKSEAKALGTKPNLMAGTGRHMGPSQNILEALGHVFAPSRVFGSSGTNSKGGGVAISSIGNPVPFGGLKGAEQIGKGTISDAVNLGPNTIEGAFGLGKDVAQGKFGDALHALVDPIVQTLANPGQAFYQHPLNTAMILGGPEAVVGRTAGAAARSGALGEAARAAADTTRAPLRLGPDVAGAPSPILEHRSYSPNIGTKAIQVAREKALQKRGIDPNVARPSRLPKPLANALNAGLEAKTRRIPDEMTSNRQAEGRDVRGEAIHIVNAARPHKSVQNVVSHILQGVVRAPETAVEDLAKEINRLKATDSGIRNRKTIQGRKQVRDLSVALHNPEKLAEAFKAAEKLRGSLHTADAYLVEKGLLDPEQAVRSRSIVYAMAHMGARYDHGKGEFVTPNGHPLSTEAILEHIKTSPHKMPDPAYVGHYPAKVAPFRFYQAYKAARGTLGGVKRTGEAFRSGGYDHSYDALVAQAARTAEATTKAGLHDKIVSRLGIKKPAALQTGRNENGFFTPEEARRYARASTHDDNGNRIPGAQPLVPLTAFNAKTPLSAVAHLQSPSELKHVDGLELEALKRAQDDVTKRKDTTRNVVLVPQHAMDQFARQFKPAGGGARKLGQITQQFKRTVLPYSTHWMTQIASEGLLRSTLTGVLDPRNLIAGRQMTRALEKSEEGRNAIREMTSASFYNRNDPLAKHNPNPSPALEALRHSPVAPIMKAHNAYANRIGSAIGGLEHSFRRMGLGKISRKQLQEFTKSYQAGVKLQGHNVSFLAEKLKSDPALVAKFGRQIDDTFGKYNKLSPKVRGAVQSVTPFLPWYLNAAKFVLYHLPAKHPVASSLLASLRQTVNQDVQDGKQQLLNPFQVSALARFTPFGLWPEEPTVGSALETATDTALPQVSGFYNVLHGQNVFGDAALRGPGGDVKPFANATVAPAIEALLEAVLPGLSKLRQAREKGGKAYGTSTVLHPQTKPGTTGDLAMILDRMFNPLNAFKSAGAAKTSGGPGSSLKDALGPSGAGSLHDALGPSGSSSIQGALGP